MLALIDGDVFKWRYAAAGEYDSYVVLKEDEEFFVRGIKKARAAVKEGGDFEFVEHVIDPIENVLHSVKVAIDHIKEVCGCKSPRIFLGGEGNYREKIYPRYKESRVGRDRPHHQKAVIEYLVARHGAEFVDGMEADDAMAINQTSDTVICSPDKDMLQVAGRHYNFVTQEKKTITPREGDFLLYQQVITGDAGDDIPGIKGLGPVKAARLLEGSKDSEELLERALKAWEGNVENMLLTARLVYLRRSEHDDFVERREVSRYLHALKREATT